MASLFDIFSLLATIAFFGGAIYLVIVIVNKVSDTVKSTKESLKSKGLHISDKGVSVKTTQRFNREDYVDATQRGFIKAMGASSFGTAGTPTSPGLERSASSTSSIHSRATSKKNGTGMHTTDSKK